MSISDEIRKAASVDIFSLANDKHAFVGHPFYFDYSTAYVLIADSRKNQVKGIPQGTFLLAFYSGPGSKESDKEAVLLRALKPTALPTDQEVIKSMIEYYKDNLKVNGEASQLDDYTRFEFSFSGLECRVLGTFYENQKKNLVFGADLENFYSAHNYNVYKPSALILERIINFREGDSIPGQVSDVRIGLVRYSSSTRNQDQDQDEKVPFYVSPADFLGKRTALFGMTRTGKSNTVKKIIQATVEISNKALFNPDVLHGQQQDFLDENPSNPLTEDGRPKYPVGQIIFDINGEYANQNLQDEGTAISEMFQNKVTRFSILPKDNFKVMKTNFYEDLEEGFEILKSNLLGDTRQFVQNFCNIDFSVSEDKKDDFSFQTRYSRLVAAYKCCLHLANFKHKDQIVNFKGEQILNALTGIDPSTGISYDKAVSWFTAVWEAMGKGVDLGKDKMGNDKGEFFKEYKKKHDNDWADDDLQALLVMLTRKRNNTAKGADCAGYRVLGNYISIHTEAIDKPYADTILDLLRAGKIVIADLSQGDETIIKLYSDKICHRIFKDAMNKFIQNKSNNFIQVYFEEAHNLFPKKDDKDLSQVYNRLAKEGAKLHIGLIYATQEVSSISSNILKNTQNWFISHLNNSDEIKEIEKYYDYKDFSDSLTKFSSSTDKGFIRAKTYSNPFTVPVQVDQFASNKH